MVVDALEADDHIALCFVKANALDEAAAVDVSALKRFEIDGASIFDVDRSGTPWQSRHSMICSRSTASGSQWKIPCWINLGASKLLAYHSRLIKGRTAGSIQCCVWCRASVVFIDPARLIGIVFFVVMPVPSAAPITAFEIFR
jgi:hypothetical protein